MGSQGPDNKGSFGGQFEELVKHFQHELPTRPSKSLDKRELQEQRDIHALLFERAWNMDRKKPESDD